VKVVLRSDVDPLGRKGDITEVADGYARNFLVPKGLAFPATRGALAQAEAMRRARDLREARDREAAQEMASRLTGVPIRVLARASSGGRLFGSVTAPDLAAAIEDQTGVAVEARAIRLDEPIKSLGVHEVAVTPYGDVVFHLTVEVVVATT